MTFEEAVDIVATAIDGVGVAIIVGGILVATCFSTTAKRSFSLRSASTPTTT